MKIVTKLTDDHPDGGVWQVKTEASSYLIDLDNRQFLRNPGDGAGADPSIPGRTVTVGDLSDVVPDSEWLPLWNLEMCEVGVPMVLTSRGFSWVRSTIVRSIEQVVRNDEGQLVPRGRLMRICVTRYDFTKWGYTVCISPNNVEQNVGLHLGKRSIYLVWGSK